MKTHAKPSPSSASADKITPIAAGKQTPRRLRRAAEILVAAREVFLEKGFEGASVSEIANRVGVVEGLVYTYFPTKRELLNEVLRGMYEPLIEEIASSFARIHGLRSRLRYIVWRHLRVYVEEPNLSRLVLHEVRTSPEYFKSVLHELHVRYTSFLLLTVREAVAAGELPADTDAETVRSMVYGGIEHRMWSLLYGRGSIDVELLADRYTAMVLHGLGDPAREPAAGAANAEAPISAEEVGRRLARLERLVAERLDPSSSSSSSSPLRAPAPLTVPSAESSTLARTPRRRKANP